VGIAASDSIEVIGSAGTAVNAISHRQLTAQLTLRLLHQNCVFKSVLVQRETPVGPKS
jgi:hypothetical protein